MASQPNFNKNLSGTYKKLADVNISQANSSDGAKVNVAATHNKEPTDDEDNCDDDDEEFEDAVDLEILSSSSDSDMSLDQALEESKIAINLFFNNKFSEARDMMRPWASRSMYHSVGASVFAFLEAILTFEQKHIREAAEALKLCLTVCSKFRRKQTLGGQLGRTFRGANYSEYTELEAHAELCYAEALLLKAMLTFIEDETLASLIKGGMKIRNCYGSYKECSHILDQLKWESSDSKEHYESGVRMGLGTFNLMISLLPGRVIKLLEFIGFSGNKESGLQDLMSGYNLVHALRQVLCCMTLLGYHLIVCYVLSHQEGNLELCEEILTKQLEKYPNGVWFLFFKGRLEFMKGNLDSAIAWYKKSWKSQNLWPQFHHLCYWELLWVNCLKLDWREASIFANYLVSESKWSRTIYSYQKAAILLMLDKQELSFDEVQLIDKLIQSAPKYKQRIAGKSLPMEKFILKKCARYFQQKRSLTLPAIELMFLWNQFKIIGKSFEMGDSILKLIDVKLEEINSVVKNFGEFHSDNKALILLLKGSCLRYMKMPMQALKCLEAAISLQKQIKDDTYIVPYSIVEIALLYHEKGDRDMAVAALEDAKRNYTGYSLESRLHFRIHAALLELKAIK